MRSCVHRLGSFRLYSTYPSNRILPEPVAKQARDIRARTSSTKWKTFVWGSSRTGALGIKTPEMPEDYFRHVVHHPIRLRFPTDGKNVMNIAAGYGFSVFVFDGKLFGTGINTDGQLGYPSSGQRDSRDVILHPTVINLPFENDEDDDSQEIKSMSAGRAHLVVLTKNGSVFTLGNNSYGQCARRIISGENQQASCIIHRIRNLAGSDDKIQAVECGQDHSLFLTESGKLLSCGWGADGQTGVGNYECISDPRTIEGDLKGEKVVKVSSRADCVLALTKNGQVFGWGNSEYGQLNEPSDETTQINTPKYLKKLSGIGRIVDIATGGAICLALNEQGDVFTWGYGILGVGPHVEHSYEPKRIPHALFDRNDFEPNNKVESIYCGIFHMGAINSKGDLYMWGKNRFGCLGLGHKKDQYFPFKVGVNAKVHKIECGVDHTVAVCRDFA